MAVTMRGFYHCWNNNKALRHNADDIIRALHAGEQWRADLRAATGAVQSIQDETPSNSASPPPPGRLFTPSPRENSAVKPVFPAATNLLFTNSIPPTCNLIRAGASPPWTWELELNPTRKDAKVCPLFTFETVAGPANTDENPLLQCPPRAPLPAAFRRRWPCWRCWPSCSCSSRPTPPLEPPQPRSKGC